MGRRQPRWAFPASIYLRAILAQAALQPHRQKMYLTSHDEAFREKRDDVLHLSYDAPVDEHIICLDRIVAMLTKLARSLQDG